MASNWKLRLCLLALWLLWAIIVVQQTGVGVLPGVRRSRSVQKSKAEVLYPHVGKLSDLRLNEKQVSSSSPLSWLSLDKKVNTYYFTFYNWYFFEIEFTDLGYDSFITFKVFMEDHLHDRWTERVGFKLDQSFYPGGRVRMQKKAGQNCSKCAGCCHEKGMNFDIQNQVLNLTVRQQTVKNLSGSRHDGYRYGRFWYYTPNHNLDDPANQAFQDDLTVTTFNLTYHNQDRKIEANLTHILRHKQCFSFVDQENTNTFKHNCVGGYANGRIFIDRRIAHEELQSFGKDVRSAYNLDNNRTRAAFLGVRSTSALSKKLGNILPANNWHWSGFKAFMQCFSKPQYYSKYQNIEKERYIGLHFARPITPLSTQSFQDYLFYNGKIVPVEVDYSLDENKLKKSQYVYFKGTPKVDQPKFDINFTMLSKETVEEEWWFNRKSEIRTYGFWSGWIDEGPKGEKVNFFNISGYLESTNSIY